MDINQLVKEAANTWKLEELCQDLSAAKRTYKNSQRKLALSQKESDCLCALLGHRQPSEIAKILNIKPEGLNVELARGLYRYIELLVQSRRSENVTIQWTNIPRLLEELGYKRTDPPAGREVRVAGRMWIDRDHLDSIQLEVIVELLRHIPGNVCLRIEKTEPGSVVLVFETSREGFEQIQALFGEGELTELLGVPVLDVRLAPASAPINWRQFLQNLFEPYWQQPEQLLPAGAHRSAEGSDAPEAILNLIHLLQTRQDEPTRRQAAEALGKTGTRNPDAISALTQLLRNSQDPETLWQAALSLGKLDPGNPAAGVERAKALDLGTQPDSQAVALIAAFRPKTDGEVSIRLRVEPVEEGQIYLPPNLKLTVFDESGEAFIQAQSTSTDNFLQRGFSGPPELQFSVKISLGDASITEEFLT
jgi:DNA-binding CsgD family transcriptional regulator